MVEPLIYYRQIALLNAQILAHLDSEADSLDAALQLLQERHAWMRSDNTPSPSDEIAFRSELLPIMESILAQDELIAQHLIGRQDQLAVELRSIHQAKVSQGYQERDSHPEARFLDHSG